MSELIGKGEEAAQMLIDEVDRLFGMNLGQRKRMIAAVKEATLSSEDWTYERFYDEAGLQDCEIAGQPISGENWTDEDGNPDGGWLEAPGVSIRWQRGPIDPESEDGEPWNGAFLVTVLECALKQLEFYQSGKYKCATNFSALSYVQDAINILNTRQRERFKKGVRGQHKK